jgi:tetratricopeptide (TPR) repeat protein
MRRIAFCVVTSILAMVSVGCLSLQLPLSAPPKPAPTRTVVPTSAPTIPANATTSVGYANVYCPTDDEQAWQYYNEAGDLREAGKLDEAVPLLRKAIELDPNFCDAMDNLGVLLRSQGNVEEAIYWYKKSIGIYPDNNVAHQNLAVAYRIQGATNDAIAEYQLLLKIDPNNPEGYFGLGSIYLDLDRPQEAIAQLKIAEQLYEQAGSPYVTDAEYMLGIAYFTQADCETATSYFEAIYMDMEENGSINYYLGQCYLTPPLENLDLAKKYLNKAQELGVELPAEVLKKIGK